MSLSYVCSGTLLAVLEVTGFHNGHWQQQASHPAEEQFSNRMGEIARRETQATGEGSIMLKFHQILSSDDFLGIGKSTHSIVNP